MHRYRTVFSNDLRHMYRTVISNDLLHSTEHYSQMTVCIYTCIELLYQKILCTCTELYSQMSYAHVQNPLLNRSYAHVPNCVLKETYAHAQTVIVFAISNAHVVNCVLNSTLHIHKPVLSIQLRFNNLLLKLQIIGKWSNARDLSDALDIRRNLNAYETNYVLYLVTRIQGRIEI